MRFASHHFYEFGEFCLHPAERVLTKNNSPVDVTPKAFDILLLLVEHAGHLVTKQEILSRVWPDSVVEEANLSHHIFRLRKALGETDQTRFIETVPTRGYRFVADVSESKTEPPAGPVVSPGKGNFFSVGKVLITGVVILLAASVIGYFVWSRIKQKTQSSNQTPIIPNNKQLSITRITTSGRIAASTISPDGKFIAYSENYFDGTGSIFLRQTDTNAEVQLLEPGERIFGSMAFSPDNNFIHYILFDQQHTKGALYRLPVLGGQPTKLIDDVNLTFSLSPDGKKAAFFRDDANQQQKSLMVAALDGGETKVVLSRRTNELQFGIATAWSPDGKLLAFSGAEQPASTKNVDPDKFIFVAEVESGRTTKLSRETVNADGLMKWTSDQNGIVMLAEKPRIGNQIFFISYPEGELQRITKELNVYGNYGLGLTSDSSALVANLWETSSQLWTIDAGGSSENAEQLTNGLSDGARGLTVLADGRIAYSSRSGEDYDLWMLSDKGGRREGKPLSSDAYMEGEICASRDNQYLFFSSDRAGNQHLFRMHTDGSEVTQLTFGDEYNTSPACSPDGTSIVYASHKNGSTNIWRISTAGGTPVQVTDFEALSPSVSPDGKSIACIIPSDSVITNARLVVINAAGGPPQKTFDVIPFAWTYRAARWTPDGKSLVFHKTEKQTGNLWKQDLEGGTPGRLTNFKSEMIFNYVFSTDGQRLIVSRGKRTVNVVMLKNFM